MKYKLQSDQPVTNEASKKVTGKTLDQWYRELDGWDGLKKGRRLINNYLAEQKVDPWWCTTIAVEYEKKNNLRKKDGLYEGYFVCSTKTISAPVEKVFEAWSDINMLSQWFGNNTKSDLRDGGVIETKDGENGNFSRVRKNKDIRLSLNGPGFSAPFQIDAQFQDKGKGKTGVLVNLTRLQTREEADAVRNAWAEALDNLKQLCEAT
jgi:uncharacterized protein YndB with AHSA1/START domain